MKSETIVTIVLMITVLTVFVVGGSQDVSARKHKLVPEKKRHELLEGGPYKGEWKTSDLTLHYEYAKEPGRLLISGKVEFSRARKLQNFSLEAYLIDADGKIVKKKAIASGGNRQRVEEIPFKSEIEMPAETWGVAFGYDGTSGGGGGSGSGSSFWKSPF